MTNIDCIEWTDLDVGFTRRNHENNSLFFLALRKFLDDFDSAYIDA